MRRFWRDNGLTMALGLLFLGTLGGMIWSGWLQATQDAVRDGAATPSLPGYLASGNFVSALFENWESEFLQMAAFVVLTAILFQRGSSQSRDPDDPGRADDEAAPGLRGWLYAHSLGVVLAALFVLSFVLHWLGSWRNAADEAVRRGEAAEGLWQHLLSARLWFESMQNWQSEFLSTAVLVVLSIWLRHKGSPESKPVRAAHDETGA